MTAVRPLPALRAALLAGLLAATLAGCNQYYAEGQLREAQGRWEEAAIQYHLAAIRDPSEPDYQEAYLRANRQVARENMETYKRFLADKEFGKAYGRLVDAASQDPTYPPVQEEQAKWMRVLVGGQMRFDFTSLQENTAVADELRLVVRINTPNPGETVDADVDVTTGIFYAENLLYDRPDELLTNYTLNSIGLSLLQGKSRTRQFSTRDFVRFVNFRAPVLENVSGTVALNGDEKLKTVAQQRVDLRPMSLAADFWYPPSSPSYQLSVSGDQVRVQSSSGGSDFTPRYLYLNKLDRRMFVDFGQYQVHQSVETHRWGLKRLSLQGKDYFAVLSQNLALQPYFFYREAVVTFIPAG